jgi:integrase
MIRTGASFADAAAEYLRYHEHDRGRKPVYGLRENAAADVEKLSSRASGDIPVFSQEVWASVRAAASEQDGALFLTAAFTGLRMGELLALRWRDVDFAGSTSRVRASYNLGQLTTPKSGKVRAVPIAPRHRHGVGAAWPREHWVGDDDLGVLRWPARGKASRRADATGCRGARRRATRRRSPPGAECCK